MNHSTSQRFLGVTILADFIQNEGVDAVLRNVVDRAGASAVACNPTVTAPADERTGGWQPPSDAGASVRLFDRPLWGKRSLWIRGAPSFHPNHDYYQDTPYSPRKPNDLTDSQGAIVAEFILAAKDRGLKVYFQVGAAQPPGLREEDIPRLPDGRLPQERMAGTGSLASAAIRSYNRAYVRDLFTAYPDVDGVRVDWPEYPCYKLDEAFQDFGDHARSWSELHGFDFERMRQEVGGFYDLLHGGLTNDDLEDFASMDRGKFSILHLFNRCPGIADWFRFKAALSTDLLREWRKALACCGGADKELSANAFMPPFSYITGLDFAQAAEHCDSISPKLYTMHWSLMVKFWGEVMLQRNEGLDEALLVKALVNLLDLSENEAGATIEDYGYPAPDEPHPIPTEPQARKINQALQAVGGRAKIYALVHGYGPLADFCRRFQLVADTRTDGVWINRYGYLSDEKLDAIGKMWK